MNRRLKIFFYWVMKSKNNVKFRELINFLIKPKVYNIANRYIKRIEEINQFFIVYFHKINYPLYWPKIFPINELYQVTTETFDNNDWHYYQKEHTTIEKGEILLDIGAAEGLFSLSATDRCDKIFIIEPNKYFKESLEKTFSEILEKVNIINVGVGDKIGKFHIDEKSISSTIKEIQGECEVTTVDNLFYNRQRISFLKADIEGFEISMLRGAAKTIEKYKPKIAITTYHEQNSPQEIISFILNIVPEYKFYVKGIEHWTGKPVMIHFWT
jgi:FkbM family methyltransferase